MGTLEDLRKASKGGQDPDPDSECTAQLRLCTPAAAAGGLSYLTCS